MTCLAFHLGEAGGLAATLETPVMQRWVVTRNVCRGWAGGAARRSLLSPPFLALS